MDKSYYSCSEFAKMKLPGYPTTRQAWDSIVRKNAWAYITVKSRGRRGLTREYMPDAKVLDLISKLDKAYTRPSIAELLGGIGNGDQHTVREPQTEAYGDHINIDKYVDVKGSAGPGQDVHDEAIVCVRVDARLLRDRIGNNFNHIKIAGVSGESMEPTLSHGDQVLVDTSCERFVDDAIYAIQQDGHLRFKRIKLRLDGSIIVKSDNPVNNDPETYTKEEAEYFKVIGVVIPFKFGRFKI